MVDSYALEEKHSLWDEAKRAQKTLEQSWKDSKAAQKKDEREVAQRKNQARK